MGNGLPTAGAVAAIALLAQSSSRTRRLRSFRGQCVTLRSKLKAKPLPNTGTYSDGFAGNVTITASVGAISPKPVRTAARGAGPCMRPRTDLPRVQTVTITADSGIGAAGTSTTMFTRHRIEQRRAQRNVLTPTSPPSMKAWQVTPVSFANQSDPSSDDTAAGFRQRLPPATAALPLPARRTRQAAPTASRFACWMTTLPAAYTIRARIIDKDEGFFTGSHHTVTVNDVAPITRRSTSCPLPTKGAPWR